MPPQPPVQNSSSGADMPYRISPPNSPGGNNGNSRSSSSRRMFGGSSTGGRSRPTGSTNLDDGLAMLSPEERILHSSYNDEDGSSIARSIASQRSARSGGYGAYDNRSIRPDNRGGGYRGSGGGEVGGHNGRYGPSAGHDSFEDRTQQTSPDGGQGIGRRIGKAVRRLSGGHLSQDLGRLVDLFDAKHGDDPSVDLEADDTTYDDNVYGAVINDQERLLEKRRSRRNACMVCLMVGMMAGFVLVVYGVTAHTRGSGVYSRSSDLGAIGGALGVSEGDSIVDTQPTGDKASSNETKTDPPTLAPTDVGFDKEEFQEDLGNAPIDASSKLPPPPANLSTVCAPSSVLTAEGRLACHTLCHPARCCFIEANGVMHRTLGCRDSRSEDCQTYERLCSILDEKYDGGEGSGDEVDDDEDEEDEKEQGTTTDEDTKEQDIAPGELAPIPEMLPSLCSPSSLDDTYEACKSGCTKAECCYMASGHPLSCASEDYTCALYDQICSALDYYDQKTGKGKDITIEIPSIPADLSEICSPSSLETPGGLKACHKECFYSTCCDISACTVTNPELCEGYAVFCSNLSELNIADSTPSDSLLADKEETEDGTSIFIGEGSEEGDPDHPTSGFSQKIFDRVSQVCSQQALTEPGGISTCNIACRPAMCCFYSEKDMAIVKGGQSDENHLGGSATATCISNKSDEWCSSYSPCQLLLHMDDEDLEDGIISSKELSEAVDQACFFPEESEIDACEQICSPGKCCFDETLPCSSSMDCSVYKSCQQSNNP